MRDGRDFCRLLIWRFGFEIKRTLPHLLPVACKKRATQDCQPRSRQPHLSLSFSRGNELQDPDGLLQLGTIDAAMRSVKFESVTEIPKPKLTRLIKEAVAVDSAPQTNRKAVPQAKRDSDPMPKELKMALEKSATATKPHDSPSLSGKHKSTREFQKRNAPKQ